MDIKGTQYTENLFDATSRIDTASKFFDLLFGSVQGEVYSYLWTRPDEATYPFKISDADIRKAMARRAISLSDEGKDVYIGVNCGNEPADKYKRYTATQVTLQTATVTDIDVEGGNHSSTADKIYPPNFAVAKSFLPLDTSLVVDSGYGLHGYCVYSEPITITDDNRAACETRNRKFIEAVRRRAGVFSKAVDGVGDLPRVLRVPGTYNYKLGSGNAPLVKLVEVNDIRFTPADMDARLAALEPPAVSKQLEDAPPTKPYRDYQPTGSEPTDQERALAMLAKIPCAEQTYEDWIQVGMILKNNGNAVTDWTQWSRDDERFKDGECEKKWAGFKRGGLTIATLHMLAKLYGYTERDFQREWHDLRGDRPRRPARLDGVNHDADLAQKLKDWQEVNGTIAPAPLTSIHDAVAFLKGLSVDNITADIANSSRFKEAVALCQFYETGGAQEAVAKVKLAKDRATAAIRAQKKAGGEFVAEPDIALVALADVSLTDLSNDIKTLFNTHRKAHKSFQKYEEQRKAREKAQEKREAQLMKVENAYERLSKLKALPKTPERDKAIIETIKELCSWRLDSHDNPIKIEATQANIDLIFVNDPNLDVLFAYDEFITADVFMKSPPWEEKQAGEEWKPADDARLQTYLQRTYTEFHDEKLIKRNFTDYSQARKFHVIRDYFNNLPAWDGAKRAETFFIDWLKVDDTPFAREVTLNWLTAAIARIFKPGCRYRYVLTLVGEQNIGKDFCFQRLGVKWHSSISDSLDDPHSLDALIISWLAVFEEMNAANKASVNAVKSFTSRNEDTRRESYAPRATRRPRQSVYAITTNDDKFLSDLTGNTRFLILRCNVPESEPIKEVRGEKLTDDNVIAQIWAEVFAHYKEMFPQGINEHNEAKLSLSVEATKAAADVTKLYLRDDGTVEKVKTFVDTKILPPVIWDLLNREQRRKFFVEQSFTIETGVLKALFKQRRVTAQRQADFDAATAKGAFVRHIVAYDKGTRVDTTYYQFFGTVYRQHICAAEVIEEAFDKTDKRKQPAKIHEIVKRLDGWHLGKRIARDPQYGNQPVVYYRDADNIPADIDDEAATVESSEPRADKSAATADNVTVNGNGMNLITAGYNETQASTPDAQPVDEWQGEPVDEDDLPFD